jgi:hypothetical protein
MSSRNFKLIAIAALVLVFAYNSKSQSNDCPSLDLPGIIPGFEKTALFSSFDNTTTNVALTNCSSFQPIRFCGRVFTSLWINEDGNVTLDGPLGGHIPSNCVPSLPLTNLQHIIFAPFWADLDTTTNGSGAVSWGCGCVSSRLGDYHAFVVTWRGVGYYKGGHDKTNTFQLLMLRPFERPESLDLQYRYESIQWDTADSASGHGGLTAFGAGEPARAGFAFFTSGFELAGSSKRDAFLDGTKATSLSGNLLEGTNKGVYTWHFTTNCPPWNNQ